MLGRQSDLLRLMRWFVRRAVLVGIVDHSSLDLGRLTELDLFADLSPLDLEPLDGHAVAVRRAQTNAPAIADRLAHPRSVVLHHIAHVDLERLDQPPLKILYRLVGAERELLDHDRLDVLPLLRFHLRSPMRSGHARRSLRRQGGKQYAEPTDHLAPCAHA